MNWEVIITALITAAGVHFFPEIAKVISTRFSKTPQERKDDSRNLSAKTESEIVKSANEIAAGSTVAVTNLLRAIEFLKLELAEARTDNAKLESEIEAIKEARRVREEETQKERETLEARIQAELIDSKTIRVENLEKEKRINKLEEMAIKQSEYIDTMKKALQKADIPVPLNGELLESARRLKLSREERERLKAGK